MTYEAVFDFPGELDTHLTLRQGDVVHVHRKEDNGWWRGTVADKTGWFPSNYVQAVLHGRLSHLGLECVGEGGGNRRRGVGLDVHSPFLHYPLVPSFRKINIGKTGNQNPPDLKGQGGSGYLFFQY